MSNRATDVRTPSDATTPSGGTTLVLGASGKTGRRVLARLRLRGVPVRAASRSSSTRFDWSDPSGWDAALRGVSAVHLVPPTTPGTAQEFVARAGAAGVRHVVLLSGRGADTWGASTFGQDMRSAEDAVRASPLSWTILRASNFAQNFDEDLFHAPLLAGELALPAGEVPEPFVDAEDVAEAAAAVLTDPDRHAGRVHELTGPRSITFAEAVDLISRASGRPIGYRRTTPAQYVADLVGRGASAGDAEHVAAMFALMERGLLSTTTEDLRALLGRSPETFEDHVARAAAAGAWRRL